MQLKTSDFYYDLPKELIAQDPLTDRAASRLMVLDKKTGEVEHHIFRDVINYLNPGDCLVINNTKVIPARLIGTKADTGASIEVLLLRQLKDRESTWETLVRPGKKCKVGTKISFGDGLLTGEVVDIVEDGNRYIRFSYDGIFEEILDKLGQMPLPPYITHTLQDRSYYNTVYAKFDGSAAAPTAGLHFTKELLKEIQDKGVGIAQLTLHVGLGTFRPVKVDNIEEHHMHVEHCMINEATAKLINDTKKNGGRIIAVGTTSCRTLESMAQDDGTVRSGEMDTGIFIYPGYKFKVMDALIDTDHACLRPRRQGEHPERLQNRCPGALSLLLIRGRDADPMMRVRHHTCSLRAIRAFRMALFFSTICLSSHSLFISLLTFTFHSCYLYAYKTCDSHLHSAIYHMTPSVRTGILPGAFAAGIIQSCQCTSTVYTEQYAQDNVYKAICTGQYVQGNAYSINSVIRKVELRI